VSRRLGVAIPFWLDRPDEEAVEIAQAARVLESLSTRPAVRT